MSLLFSFRLYSYGLTFSKPLKSKIPLFFILRKVLRVTYFQFVILFSLMNHAQPSMNKHECAIARQRQPVSQPVAAWQPSLSLTSKKLFASLLPGNRTDTFIDIFKNIFFARFHVALATVGRAGRAFVLTDLLTSLREE